jgi:hypothetical protein
VSPEAPAPRIAPAEAGRGWLAARALTVRRRFVVALVASLAAHLALLSGIGLPEIEHVERSEGPPIAARIAPLAPPAAAPEAAKPPAPAPAKAAKPRAKRASKAAPAPRLALPSEPQAPLAVPPASSAEAPDAAPAEPGPGRVDAPAQPAQRAPPDPQPAEAPDAEAIAFPARIELEFDVAKSADHAPVGRVVHRFERDGARYLIQSVTAAAGIAVLFVAARYVQESRGTLTAQGLRPEQFAVRRGRNERTESAAFDWAAARATVTAGGASREWPLQPGAQDQLSLLHQLSFLMPSPPNALMVTNGRRFYIASLEVVGIETVATGLGPVSALQIRSQLEGESRIEVWIAPDYGNLPVKLRVRDRRGEEFEQVLAAMKVLQ